MLQQDHAEDFVIATGKSYTIRTFVEKAFSVVGIDIMWEGEDVNEKGIDKSTRKVLVEINEKYFRPAEVEFLLGNPKKANEKLGWVAKTDIDELVYRMVHYDLKNDNYGGSEVLEYTPKKLILGQ